MPSDEELVFCQRPIDELSRAVSQQMKRGNVIKKNAQSLSGDESAPTSENPNAQTSISTGDQRPETQFAEEGMCGAYDGAVTGRPVKQASAWCISRHRPPGEVL